MKDVDYGRLAHIADPIQHDLNAMQWIQQGRPRLSNVPTSLRDVEDEEFSLRRLRQQISRQGIQYPDQSQLQDDARTLREQIMGINASEPEQFPEPEPQLPATTLEDYTVHRRNRTAQKEKFGGRSARSFRPGR